MRMHALRHTFVAYHDERMCNSTMWPSVLCAFLCCCCLHSRLPLRVSQVCICTLACICLSACFSTNISQKQHITQLSLHPKEVPFHSRMLLVELRRIFLTVSLTLCWQTGKHPHIPKQCREKWCSILNSNSLLKLINQINSNMLWLYHADAFIHRKYVIMYYVCFYTNVYGVYLLYIKSG